MEYTALILFTLATSITPGPNNVMIMTSGANHGFRKSIPHLLGIDLGFPIMLIAIGLGAGQIFQQSPSIFIWLKIIGSLYLTYLAYKIATAPVQNFEAKKAKPMTFFQAVLFQWVNPKAWIMCIGAVVTYTVAEGSYFQQVLVIALLFFTFGSPCTVTWLWFGSSLKKVLSNPKYLRAFNLSMGLLLMASLLPVLRDLYASFSID
ncbi:LysE family translocator [Aliikangiella coralliicola]|uniref:LysE family translocator n=1 Tax=Aliikangiella coralliicola TaxID=2592383 RepID=A0A545UDV5_9GAMM|nr:LysE family translocator [Aliikangiella coralliicola]TQV87603.1 LysE family translocator [Aliikangiella coralliicola]